MAAEGVCPFPLPPTQYYKLYTDENVEKNTAPEPPPPVDGAYTMFGASFEVKRGKSLNHHSIIIISRHCIGQIELFQCKKKLVWEGYLYLSYSLSTMDLDFCS